MNINIYRLHIYIHTHIHTMSTFLFFHISIIEQLLNKSKWNKRTRFVCACWAHLIWRQMHFPGSFRCSFLPTTFFWNSHLVRGWTQELTDSQMFFSFPLHCSTFTFIFLSLKVPLASGYQILSYQFL